MIPPCLLLISGVTQKITAVAIRSQTRLRQAAPVGPSMTLRESISKRKRTAAIVTYLGFAWSVVCMALSESQIPSLWFYMAIPGLASSFVGTLYLTLLLRCPNCRGRIGYALNYGSPFSVSPKIRFCPLCGVALDSELKVHDQPRRVVGPI